MGIHGSGLVLRLQAFQAFRYLCKGILVIFHANLCCNLRMIPQGSDPKEIILLFSQFLKLFARNILKRDIRAADLLASAVRFFKR